jgi:anti-sigma factor RsiW
MKSTDAKQLLEVFRANGADAQDPRFQEALKQAGRDPELRRWFEEQRNFDAGFADNLRSVTAPADLKDSILAAGKIVKPGLWHDWRIRTAAAAAVVVLLAVAGALQATGKTQRFPEFRAELIEQAWDGQAHLDFESSDVQHIKLWLAQHNASPDFTLPQALKETRIVGCRVVEAEGRRVPMLCLADGAKHMHLFVVDEAQFAGLPPQGTPDFEKCGGWKTTSWQHAGRTYVLTGMKYQTFVSKFRKSGRWTMSG